MEKVARVFELEPQEIWKPIMDPKPPPKTRRITGFWEAWYENGQKEAERNFENGKEVGEWKYWDKNGVQISKEKHDLLRSGRTDSRY